MKVNGQPRYWLVNKRSGSKKVVLDKHNKYLTATPGKLIAQTEAGDGIRACVCACACTHACCI